eukprot:CAMPEP_0118693694 /NCGR_PEP_ID=MMETSP0800-20121206/12060_1 /TAXON_ID=210618 ORGANISM="Striatella unipunctata, Strain CCMP2910" /NCGR_SAMPLE_ID=MMETSP0800 /ASSEMBLY_ACC=CAM_ASM_000638 /LENGTH=220 /DNA_ID=CAMNT_0006591977 /DNA_START=36 /DNA_END=698 /DNA_ORIENTATION=-
MKFTAGILFTILASASAAVPSLTPDNYDSLTDGKTVFLKFFAPWCGHCKKMAPDWEKLANDWSDDKVGLIAEIDCTAEGKPLCDANGIRGFPTLKYGDPTSLDDYQGGRDFDSLASFAKKNLIPVCSVNNIDLCDDEKKALIGKYQGMSAEELDAAIEGEETKLADAEELFKNEVQKLQEAYQKLSTDKDNTIAEVKGSGLGMMKSVKAAMTKSSSSDEL